LGDVLLDQLVANKGNLEVDLKPMGLLVDQLDVYSAQQTLEQLFLLL
jgi:hypothetical protein